MYRSSRTQAPHRILSHVLAATVGVAAAMGCGGGGELPGARSPEDGAKPTDGLVPDSSTQPASRESGDGSCSKYPATTRTDSNGTTWYWWYLDWQSASTDLARFCATYGAGASMIVEVAVPQNPSPTTTLPVCTSDEIRNGGSRACAIADSYRFEAPCVAGEMLFELPSENAFNGYYHFESAAFPAQPRHLVNQDVHCTRDLYLAALEPGAILVDAGPDSAGPPDVLDASSPDSSACPSSLPSGPCSNGDAFSCSGWVYPWVRVSCMCLSGAWSCLM